MIKKGCTIVTQDRIGNVITTIIDLNIKKGDFVKIGKDYGLVNVSCTTYCELEWIIRGEKKITNPKELFLLWSVHNIEKASKYHVSIIEGIQRKHRWNKVGKRAELYGNYFSIINNEVEMLIDMRSDEDTERYFKTNYFMTYKQAAIELDRINKLK